jgi:hypothetical protein
MVAADANRPDNFAIIATDQHTSGHRNDPTFGCACERGKECRRYFRALRQRSPTKPQT